MEVLWWLALGVGLAGTVVTTFFCDDSYTKDAEKLMAEFDNGHL